MSVSSYFSSRFPAMRVVLKMPSPAGVLTVRGDRTAAVPAVERLHALAPVKAPKVQPFDPDDIPVKTV